MYPQCSAPYVPETNCTITYANYIGFSYSSLSWVCFWAANLISVVILGHLIHVISRFGWTLMNTWQCKSIFQLWVASVVLMIASCNLFFLRYQISTFSKFLFDYLPMALAVDYYSSFTFEIHSPKLSSFPFLLFLVVLICIGGIYSHLHPNTFGYFAAGLEMVFVCLILMGIYGTSRLFLGSKFQQTHDMGAMNVLKQFWRATLIIIPIVIALLTQSVLIWFLFICIYILCIYSLLYISLNLHLFMIIRILVVI